MPPVMAYARHQAALQTPIGTIVIEGDDAGLHAIRIAASVPSIDAEASPAASPTAQAARQLAEYFAGRRQHFTLPLHRLPTRRGEVLRAAIISVGYGETLSYGALAKRCDSGARAIGSACARNPFPIVVPCHRIISAAGGQENYSAGDGPATKAWLIAHERRYSERNAL